MYLGYEKKNHQQTSSAVTFLLFTAAGVTEDPG